MVHVVPCCLFMLKAAEAGGNLTLGIPAIHAVDSAGQTSRTSDPVAAVDTHGTTSLPASRSAAVRIASRWRTAPFKAGRTQAPQMPEPHAQGTSTPASSSAWSKGVPAGTGMRSPRLASTSSQARPSPPPGRARISSTMRSPTCRFSRTTRVRLGSAVPGVASGRVARDSGEAGQRPPAVVGDDLGQRAGKSTGPPRCSAVLAR